MANTLLRFPRVTLLYMSIRMSDEGREKPAMGCEQIAQVSCVLLGLAVSVIFLTTRGIYSAYMKH
jgi:hypothetical protein